jgi:DNA-binding CsgD family transcriptional regulator
VPTLSHFVGRDADLAQIQALLSDATLGNGGALLVEGETGIGKSRFLFEAARLRSPAKAIAVSCGPAGLHSDGRSSQLDETLRAVQAAQGRPVAIFVDDVHRADSAELRTFAALLALTRRLRMVVVASYSPESLPPAIAAEMVRWRETGVARRSLDALSDAETELLILSVALRGHSLSSETVRAMLHCAQGNPRVAVELAESLSGGAGGTALVAPSAAASVGELREHVPEEAFEILRLCSVVGETFRDQWIVDLAETSRASVASALQQAIERGVLLELDGPPGWLRFRRTAVREALYASTVSLKRRLLHERVVNYLSRLSNGDVQRYTIVAQHWHALGNAANAAHAFASAAGQSAASEDFAAAADAYSQALRHLTAGSQPWFDAAHDLRRCLRNLAEWARMIPVVESIIAVHDAQRDPETASSLLSDLFFARLNNAQLESAREVAQRIGEPTAALIVAYALCYAGRMDEARELLATIEFDGLTDPEARMRHLISTAAIGALYHPIEYARERVDAAADIASTLGLRGTVLAYGEGIEIALRHGNLEAARIYERKAAAVAAKTKGDVNDVKRLLDKDRIRIAISAGELATARGLIYALLSWRDFGRHNQSFFAGVGVQVGMRMGDLALIDASFDPALLSAALAARDAESAGLLLSGYADVMLARGMAKELQSILEQCAAARLIDPHVGIPQCIARYGTLESAEAALHAAQDYLRGAVAPAALAQAAMLRALLARRHNRHIAAGEAAREGAVGFRRIGYRLAEAAALELAGDRGAASTLYAQCGATSDVTRLATGQSRKARRAPFSARLTARELEVARLVARKRSTSEIARALEVSVRTVHHHVEAVFSKLGIHARRELTEELLRSVVSS